MSKARRTVLLVVFTAGLLMSAGLASADSSLTELEDHEDTVFNFGYDSANHVFMYGTSSTDPEVSAYDCTIQHAGEPRPITPVYGEIGEVLVEVEDIKDGTNPVVFHPWDADGGLLDVPYRTDAAADCNLIGAVVAGPQGQINHGQFMKLFNSLIDMKGRGCLNRWLAQSELGKGGQQIRTNEVDPGFVVGGQEILEGVVFTTAYADCVHGKKASDGEEPTASSEKGKAKGRPDSPGKSGQAKGHNKP